MPPEAIISASRSGAITLAGAPVGFTRSKTSGTISSATSINSTTVSPSHSTTSVSTSTTIFAWPADSTTSNPIVTTINTESISVTSTDRHLPTVIATLISVPLGVMTIAFIVYLLYRYRKLEAQNSANANGNTKVSFPPDHIYSTDNRILSKAELDMHQSAINELPAPNTASELEGSPSMTSIPSNRVSVAPSGTRWSLVSSVAVSTVGVGPMAAGLQAVNHQTYGSGQGNSLAPRSQDQYRLSGPVSRLLPVIELPEGEMAVAPRPDTTGSYKHSGSLAQGVHDGKQSLSTEEVHTSEKGHGGRQTQDGGKAAEIDAKARSEQ